MTETAAAATTAAKASKAKAPRSKPAHPPTNEMVQGAIKGLKERGGSSLIAIKKYIAANYKVDVAKLAPFIKRALKSGVASGALVQTKGTGATGSFKLSATAKPAKKATKVAKKPAAKKTPKKTATKKPASKTKAAKSPSKPKAKKPKAKPTKAKSPAKKPKAPKPKKSPAKKPAAKKATKKPASKK